METPAETPDSEIIDLGFDVSAEDVARPVIKGGSYAADISYVRREPTRKSGILQWVIGLKLAEPTTDVNGKSINPGFNVVYRFLAQPSGGMTKEMIQDRLRRIHFAAAGAGRVNSGDWFGKRVQVAVRLREPHTDDQGNSYEASNEVSGIYPAKK